jgi:hypothetical protein
MVVTQWCRKAAVRNVRGRPKAVLALGGVAAVTSKALRAHRIYVEAAVVENEAEIRRPSEEVFDYCTDLTREHEWNPKTRRVEKLTGGPIGAGTRFKPSS